MIHSALLSALLAFSPTLEVSEGVPPSLSDSIALDIRGSSRGFAYTNKWSAHFYGETMLDHTSGWHGFTLGGKKVVEDYLVRINGKNLARDSVRSAQVFPDRLLRNYDEGITEEFGLVDTVAAFWVTVRSPRPVRVDIAPLFANARGERDFEVQAIDSSAVAIRRTADDTTSACWLVTAGAGAASVREFTRRGTLASPVVLTTAPGTTHTFLFFAATSRPAPQDVHSCLAALPLLQRNRHERIERILRRVWSRTGHKRFDLALAWATLSLDALAMHQGTPGIYAGLPWFNNYWGRDTFISLPGAALVTGQFDLARSILLAFAEYQERDSASSNFGRIPNFYSPAGTAYNTADGTPRYVMMLKEYIDRSGDSLLIARMYPVVRRSIEGTIRYHTDSLGYLTHGDAESWMDAVGPDGPWSPRGTRANDVQALWVQQLEAGIWFATRSGDMESERTWHRLAQSLRRSFRTHFVTDKTVVDHLRGDGSRSSELRPNMIFTGRLLDPALRARMVTTVLNRLTYSYGVASLSQDDSAFHPYHEHPPFYPKDAAYHNGTVWTWLQGTLISELCHFGRQDVGWKLTLDAAHQILDRGVAGTQSELLDAVPRPGEMEPRLSGTFSQAWNLAEFVRNWYDDYLGVRASRLTRTLHISPRLPREVSFVAARIPFGSTQALLTIRRVASALHMELTPDGPSEGWTIIAALPASQETRNECKVALPPGSSLRLVFSGRTVKALVAGAPVPATVRAIPTDDRLLARAPLNSVRPAVRPGLRALAGPQYPLIPHAVITRAHPNAVLVVDAPDREGDDTGVEMLTGLAAGYTYPRDANFVPGSFDITRFTMWCDSAFAYFRLGFRALSNPGWHPEYGFQLTMAAIAIDTDGIDGSGERRVPANARYILPASWGYERLILVGGGIRIEDFTGKTIAAYIPAPSDAKGPFGESSSGTVKFALPLSYLSGSGSHWRFTVLAGAQDDHGGAGIGEFRTVLPVAASWNGGGKIDQDGPNVYDVLEVP